MKKAFIFIILFGCFSLKAQKTTNPIVQTVSGKLEGITEGNVSIFKRIPYAPPPNNNK